MRQDERYRLLFENHPHPMWVYDRESLRFLEVNDAAVSAYGYSRDEFLAMSIDDVRSGEDTARARALMREPRPPLRRSGPWRHRRKDGSVFEVEITSHTVDFGGRSAALVVALDVTDHVRAEKALRESEERLRFLVERTSAVLYRLNLETARYDYMSPGIERLTGYSVEEINEMGFKRMVEQVNATASAQRLRLALADGRLTGFDEFTADYLIRRKDGEPRWLADYSRPWTDETGRLIGSVGVLTDITQRKELEAQLLRSQKLEAMGRLAGGIAHDFNNMLGVILGFADLAERQLTSQDPLLRHVRNIGHAARRSADLTRQLLAFARRQQVSPRVVDLNAHIGGLRNMLARLIGENVALEFVPEPGLGNVWIDPAQLDQLLGNLATNARDAILDVGSIRIETRRVAVGPEIASLHPGRAAGAYLLLEVRDTGTGMDAATLQKIFEPFFTTKEEGRGTGLGLSSVYGIVEQAGGFIEVDSSLGRGTTFRIFLPQTLEQPEAAVEAGPPPELEGSETVLLVEDEPQLLDLAQESLEMYGYHVLAALAPKEALVLAEKHKGEIHVLVTDVVMPGMNGRELAARVLALRRGVRVVFTSGYPASVASLNGILDEGVPFVQKPYKPEALAAKVREVLAG